MILVGDGVNRGQTGAINYGLALATGDIITFQNADDLFCPNAFIEVAKAYIDSSQSTIFFGNLFIIDENDRVKNKMMLTPYSYNEQLFLGMQMHNQCMFFTPDLITKYGSLDERLNYSFDYEVMLRFTRHNTTRTRYLENLWGAFRIHSESKTSNLTKSYSQERELISRQYKSKNFGSPMIGILIKLKSIIRKTVFHLSKGRIFYLANRLKLVIASGNK